MYVFCVPHLTRHINIIVVVLSCKLTTDGLHNLWVFSCPFCATQHYGTVELVVDVIIFPYF